MPFARSRNQTDYTNKALLSQYNLKQLIENLNIFRYTDQMKSQKLAYDVVVVGAGHAGCEAAIASAKLGVKTLLITGDLTKVASLPCNPSVGGPGKGHLVREIDALGGVMAKIVDASAIQLKQLNTGKGPAVRAYRAQLDRSKYNQEMIMQLNNTKNLELLQDEVTAVEAKLDSINSVITKKNSKISTKTVIICSGTFLNGEIVLGPKVIKKGGRMDAPASHGLSESLINLGLKRGRLKTGTPPRVSRRSIDFSKLEIAPGSPGKISFSHPDREVIPLNKQALCWLTYTNKKTHELILENYHLSGNTSGLITETGPRSCPSLDLKVRNFPNQLRHPIFIEPVGNQDGPDGERMYLQGCSTAFDTVMQEKIFRSIQGLEKVEFLEYGYAVRYDYFLPHQLKTTLETKKIKGLFLAGQMNGTTGYEEAAAQGLIAGINAAQLVLNKSSFVLDRAQAYIGVLIEDLVTKTHVEPYRMFTSRAEHRLLLRNDNADIRLTAKGYKIGLQTIKEYKRVQQKQKIIADTITLLKKTKTKYQNNTISAYDWLKRPENNILKLKKYFDIQLPQKYLENIEIVVKYSGYFKRQENEVLKLKQKLTQPLPQELDYEKISGLRNEARKRLQEIKPDSIAQASLIQGITPADLSIILVHAFAYAKAGSSQIAN